MKIIFLFSGLTHYYNLVLSRINNEPDIELSVIIPTEASNHIGAGVNQTRDGVNFKVIELKERNLKLFNNFSGLSDTLLVEAPDVVVTIEIYLQAFLFDSRLKQTMKKLGAGLILKTIPFRLPLFQDACLDIEKNPQSYASLPSSVNSILNLTGIIRHIKKMQLNVRRRAMKLPDAHVNYIEAYDLLASYGIDKENIFITRNSPDTDLLFSVKKLLKDTPPILPPNPFRLLHIGRLVAWKRVDMLLYAFASLRNTYADAELIIIGVGPQEKELKSLAETLNLGTSVIFTGGVYDAKVLGQYIMACSLYVLAGMGGLSINDAMSFGLPILCSVCDGTEKILVREGYNGRYFKEGSRQDLLEKIKWFFDHPAEMAKMGRNSEEIIRKEVNIHTVVKGYIDAFNYVKKKKRVEE